MGAARDDSGKRPLSRGHGPLIPIHTIFVLIAVALVINVAVTIYLFVRHWDKLKTPPLEDQPKPEEWRRR
jgi:hypothetical protein